MISKKISLRRRESRLAGQKLADAVCGNVVFCAEYDAGVYDCTRLHRRRSKARECPQCAASPLVLRTRRLQSIFRRPRSAAFRRLTPYSCLEYGSCCRRCFAGNLAPYCARRSGRVQSYTPLASRLQNTTLPHTASADCGGTFFCGSGRSAHLRRNNHIKILRFS